ncbi:MAG: ABC transporter ATP-binding protein [Desulfobacteraceae bacterium]|nr:MAG: ABC transporter ATP-binding protein [Desulfobacteraceae bacterium]
MPDKIIELKDIIIKRNGIERLRVPELVIHKGEVLSLIGPNGAGKTTLLQTLAALIKPAEGSIYYYGQKVDERVPVLEYRRRLAMVFQESLLFSMSVFDNVALGLKMRGMPKNEIRTRVMEQLERFKIAHLSGRSSKALSGGEAQRTSLARAFATDPEIFLLDEPFSALDPPTREALLEDLEAILHKTRVTTVFVTHDRWEALRLSDRIAVMNQGRILQLDTPVRILRRPADEFVGHFVGVETILSGEVIGAQDGCFTVQVNGRKIEVVGTLQVGDRVTLFIRPDTVVLADRVLAEATSARNAFNGIIEKIIPMGFYEKVKLDCGFPLVAYITHESARQLALEAGKEINAFFKATSIHVIKKTGPA